MVAVNRKPIERCTGIILNTLLFQEYDQILTAFTKEHGMVKFFVKGANRPSRKGKAQTTPLTEAEFVYTKGCGELWSCREISVKQMYLALRKDLSALEAGCSMAHSLYTSQLIHKPAPQLFELLGNYLHFLTQGASPHTLALSFQLKVLRHDGVFAKSPCCSVCQQLLSFYSAAGSNLYCSEHTPLEGVLFSANEQQIKHRLAFCRTHNELAEVDVSDSLKEKLGHFFKAALKE